MSPSGRAAEEADPVPVGEALAVVGGDLGLGDPATLAVIAAHWTDVVGEAVAGHARLRTLRGGVLTIAVDAPPWATELRYLAGEVRDRISALVASDAVQEVRIVVEPPS